MDTNTKSIHCQEVYMGDDFDSLYYEIERRILTLIGDDEKEDFVGSTTSKQLTPMWMNRQRTNMESEEDGVFYAELTRQILLLMDEDQHHEITTTNSSRNVNKSEFQRRSVAVGGGGNYFSWSEYNNYSTPEVVPSWMERLWKGTAGNGSGSGTGVFIPQVVAAGKSRRRRHHNKPKRNNGGDAGRIFHSSAVVGHKIIQT
ncbi:hypothetical protein OSB04_008898 [Centaurea solstitialis]|uniref:Uncharacterized protein n=1 Tax=Centaurea solstitialis TaxID=347529 RepID=A0AA38U767_9ASTR|nr:hypothetical protein OSB04_008898 [Centaurea solstitialis]